jgi:hypothetical protein
MKKADVIFLASKMNSFLEVVEDPKAFRKSPSDISLIPIPDCFDLRILSIALLLLGDTYLRAKGLIFHPRSNTKEIFMEALTSLLNRVWDEAKRRPYLYPKLSAAIRRSEAATELDSIIQNK